MDLTKYRKFIGERFRIVNKDGEEVPFAFNPIQNSYIEKATKRDLILKARQQGFSSLILAVFATDFLLKPNSVSVVVADIAQNATDLLDRVKRYLRSYEDITGVKVPLKYNSKYELVNASNDAKYIIGTADNVQFGRSKTITNLHLSEAAFYRDLPKLLASAESAVVPKGWVVLETTANGFNEFKSFWDESEMGRTGYTPQFFKASDFYDKEYLSKRAATLGREFKQEFPETPQEAFITSGERYFNTQALEEYLKLSKEPLGV